MKILEEDDEVKADDYEGGEGEGEEEAADREDKDKEE